MRASHHRLLFTQVHRDNLIIDSIRIAIQSHIVLRSALCSEKSQSIFIRGEYRSGSTQLCAHIGDGGTLGNGKGLYTGAVPLNDSAHAALNGENAQDLQGSILSTYTGLQFTCQLHPEYLGHIDIVSAAAHSNSHIHSACANSQHTQTATGGSMAVRANEGLTGLAKPLQVDLVANAVTGAGEPHTVLGGYRLQVAVVIRIFKAALQCVVIYIGNAQFSFYLGNTHCFKFQIGHGAGGILGQGLVNFQSDLTARLHSAGNQMRCNNLLCNRLTHFAESSQSYFPLRCVCGCKSRFLPAPHRRS